MNDDITVKINCLNKITVLFVVGPVEVNKSIINLIKEMVLDESMKY